MTHLDRLPIEDYTAEGDWETGESNEGRTEIWYRKKKVFDIYNPFNLDLIGHERAAALVCTALNVLERLDEVVEKKGESDALPK